MTLLPGTYRILHRTARFVALMVFWTVAVLSVSGQPLAAGKTVVDHPPQGHTLPEEEKETVIIDGVEYPVSPPWTGNKLIAQAFTWKDFRQIPEEFTHNGAKIYILAAVHQPLLALLHRARQEGVELRVHSGYRSARYQGQIFTRMMKEGRAFEDIICFVAPPGYSEHMLGTAVDFYPSNWEFAGSPAYAWLKENAAAFHFEETFAKNNILKMPWEAWHWNYTGAISPP